jgi:hypothetical protein
MLQNLQLFAPFRGSVQQTLQFKTKIKVLDSLRRSAMGDIVLVCVIGGTGR